MKSILLVDDDNTVLPGLGVRLKAMGYTIYTAPIIFMTASDSPAVRAQAKLLGAAALLPKPFDATSLADAIESALSPGDNWRPAFAV